MLLVIISILPQSLDSSYVVCAKNTNFLSVWTDEHKQTLKTNHHLCSTWTTKTKQSRHDEIENENESVNVEREREKKSHKQKTRQRKEKQE